jgi:hypothetical protein
VTSERRTIPRLIVVEADDAVFVCDGDGLDEWVVRFERRNGFDAEGWARRMAARSTAGACHGGPTPS